MSANRISNFRDQSHASQKLTRTLTLTSGKGGVGKSTLTANLALHLGAQGYKILILDGDLGMANMDIMFGKRATRTIHDVVSENASISDILVDVAPNVTLIPGGSGIKELQKLTDLQKRSLLDQVADIPSHFDFLLIDTAPGIDDNVLYLNSAAHEICVVVTPDPSSIADAYALMKVLNKFHKENRFSIVCNQVRDESEGLALFRRLSDVSGRFLFVSLDYKGSVPADHFLKRATKTQQLVLRSSPQSSSSEAIREIAKNLCHFQPVESLNGGLQFFFERLVGVA